MKFLIKNKLLLIISSTLLSACGGGSHHSTPFATEIALGEHLFFDKNLSKNRTQSCASCHDPERAFIDSRLDPDTGKISAVSLGDDGLSKGSRNTPTASYAKYSPSFHFTTRQRFNSRQESYQGFVGGQFLDGRELDLKGQAGGPPLNPLEMGMPDKASVVARIKENSDYIDAFQRFYGATIFENNEEAYAKMTISIAKFEKTEQFSPFDSKYDRSLTDPSVLNQKETLGKALFFSLTSCSTCHQLKAENHARETFSSYEYHNIGVPINGSADNGLFDNTLQEADKGKFKVPTLRNIAVTEPYMHNGLFQDLRTVIEFYDSFLVGSQHSINNETGLPWKEAEIPATVNLAELQDGIVMTPNNIEAMVCFLRTLTDARYEHLIQEKGIRCVN